MITGRPWISKILDNVWNRKNFSDLLTMLKINPFVIVENKYVLLNFKLNVTLCFCAENKSIKCLKNFLSSKFS